MATSDLESPPQRGGKPATLDDVAALARVSPKTVSRVVNRESGVHSDTRERVLRAIEMLDYKPNLGARMLAGDRSYTIGLFCERPGDYLSVFQAGATDRCRESGHYLVLEEWHRDSPNAVRHVSALLRQLRPDGVILMPPLSDDRLLCNILRDASVPMVRIAPRQPSVDAPSIGIDDYLAARQLTAHLLGLGHRRIAFMRGKPDHGATEQRYRGFTDEMSDQNTPVEPTLIETGNFAFSDGVECAERLLSAAIPPSAIFASNDDMAAAVVSVGHRMGLDLPRDLSVVGFDDAPVATMIWPLLTTVRQPVAKMARHAAGLIIDHCPRRYGWPPSVANTVFEFELVIRDSTSAPHHAQTVRSGPGRKS